MSVVARNRKADLYRLEVDTDDGRSTFLEFAAPELTAKMYWWLRRRRYRVLVIKIFGHIEPRKMTIPEADVMLEIVTRHCKERREFQRWGLS